MNDAARALLPGIGPQPGGDPEMPLPSALANLEALGEGESQVELEIEGKRYEASRVTESSAPVCVAALRAHDDAAGAPAPAASLTPRESEVLVWVARGKTNRDIADILGMSPRTVNKHLEHVFEKLGVETRTAAAAVARKLNIG
ncbi:MAG: helix-turn-helix transcriptional regulator [Burkholderiaceae bacterium]